MVATAHGKASGALVHYGGKWQDGSTPVLDLMGPGSWLSSMVFDGARAFDGCAPDLDLHCQRVVASALVLGLEPDRTAKEIEALCWEGIAKFPKEMALYVRPMFFASEGFVAPAPGSTRFALVVNESPLPEPNGFSACLSPYRRPTPETAPTTAKASCLYPNVARCIKHASEQGFDNAVVRDQMGNVAEFATANLFIVKDGVAHTPVANGCFLAGVTRQRVITLLTGDGIEVRERRVTFDDVMDADELFSTGNYGKVQPANRIEDRNLQPGPVARRAYELYFDWARTQTPPA